MANIVVDEGKFDRMRNKLREWNARRPEGEAEAITIYKQGNKAQGVMSFAGAQAPMLKPLLAGAVIYAVVTSEWIDKIEFLKKYWFLKPLLVLGLGYYLFRKNSPWAQAVLAAAAIMFVKAWKERPSDDKDKAKAKEAAGLDDEDAGRWEWDRHEDWREREAAQRGRALGEGRAERNAERLAGRIFEHARAA